MKDALIPQLAPCVVSHNLALGGAQTAVLRMIQCLPDWVRERTTLYCQSKDMPLLDAAVRKHDFSVGSVTMHAPDDPSCWVLSYGNLRGLPQRPTSLILHSWDDEGWRYITRTYSDMPAMTVAGVSQQVLQRFEPWLKEHGHAVAGVLPPPVTELSVVKGKYEEGGRLVVAWMGRPLASKGLMSLPYLLKLDPRIIVRAWTGAETAGLEYTRRVQAQAMDEVCELAKALGVLDRFDLRPLDFDPFAYKHRLEGAHVLLGNSRREGFLLTAAEALSCGVPVVVTRSCGVSQFVHEGVNGCVIDWDEDPKRLALEAHRAILRAARLDPMFCIHSARHLSTQAGYVQRHGETLARLTHTSLRHDAPRVTVGVRIHQGTDTTCLDDAINSIAMQSYRRFKVLLLVDGPWSFGEKLAQRYNLPLLCTGLQADITHCSWLHRQAVELTDTEFYKPLDYDDQLLPGYLGRAVETLDRTGVDVYGCKLLTLENGQITPRLHWPNKPVETMFTGNSDDNMLPHSSVLLRTDIVRKAGNYQKLAVGHGADDYHLWFRIHEVGGTFHRDDDVRNVVYRIHEKNSLKLRRERYKGLTRRIITGATAAGLALWAGQTLDTTKAAGPEKPPTKQAVQGSKGGAHDADLDAPHS